MSESSQKLTLNDACASFLGALSPESAAECAPEMKRFAGWFHREKLVGSLTPMDIAGYSERFSESDTVSVRRLEIVRKFLAYSKKEGWTESNMSVHLKARREKTASASAAPTAQSDLCVLTQQGFEDMQKELSGLKNQRPQVLEEIRRAAADKDFRENAPLHAAREQLGHIDGRILELEAITKKVVIIDSSDKSGNRVAMGDTVVLVAVATCKAQSLTIVGPKESDPANGKISHVSPIGKAIIGRKKGETVEVIVPSGRVKYRIEEIKK